MILHTRLHMRLHMTLHMSLHMRLPVGWALHSNVGLSALLCTCCCVSQHLCA